MPKLQGAIKKPVTLLRNVFLIVRIKNVHVKDPFEIVKNLVINILPRTTLIDRYI